MYWNYIKNEVKRNILRAAYFNRFKRNRAVCRASSHKRTGKCGQTISDSQLGVPKMFNKIEHGHNLEVT